MQLEFDLKEAGLIEDLELQQITKGWLFVFAVIPVWFWSGELNPGPGTY